MRERFPPELNMYAPVGRCLFFSERRDHPDGALFVLTIVDALIFLSSLPFFSSMALFFRLLDLGLPLLKPQDLDSLP